MSLLCVNKPALRPTCQWQWESSGRDEGRNRPDTECFKPRPSEVMNFKPLDACYTFMFVYKRLIPVKLRQQSAHTQESA